MNMPDLITYTDISRMLGISLGHARNRLTKRPDFPEPAVNISQRLRRWRKDDVLRWAAKVK